MNNYGIIYEAYNTFSKKRYIGQTKSILSKRKAGHIKDSKNKNTKNYFSRALNKHKNFFIWRIIGVCKSQKELDKCEKECIIFYYSTNNKYGYNIRFGGHGGGKHSEKTKNKISKASKLQKNRNTTAMIAFNKQNNGPSNKNHFKIEDKVDMILMRLNNFTTKEIGLKYNVSRDVIKRIIKEFYINGISLNSAYLISYLNRLKITNKVIELKKQNITKVQIAKQLKISVKPITKIIKEYNL